MTWVLWHGGEAVDSGSYPEMLERAWEWGGCLRAWHLDGTELAPRMSAGWHVLPSGIGVERTRAAA